MNGSQLIVTVIAIAALGILAYGVVSTRRRRPTGSQTVPSSTTVTFDEERILCQAAGKTTELRWNALIGVTIETTDKGPFFDDVFYILVGPDGLVICPSEAKGSEELLTRLQQLPGFDNEAVIAAMQSTSNQTFVCWNKKGLHNKILEGIDANAPNPQN